MQAKIIELLNSDCEDDVRIGWELLKSTGIEGEEFFPYISILKEKNSKRVDGRRVYNEIAVDFFGLEWSTSNLFKQWKEYDINNENTKMANIFRRQNR